MITRTSKAIPYLLVLSIFLISRVIFLESDIPPWNIAQYQSIDEFYYSIGGFNLFNHFIYNYITFDFLIEPTYTTNHLEDFMTFIFLEIFGNNYYGLRMGSVFSGLIIFLSVNYIVFYYNKVNKNLNIKYLFLFLSLYMILDFSFLLSNRIAEPTVFRMLSLVILFIVILFLIKNGINKINSFFLGFISFVCFIYVYTTNVFVVPAIGLVVLLISLRDNKKAILINLIMYSLGTILSILFFLLVYKILVGGNYIENFTYIYGLVSDRTNPTFFTNLVNLFSTNIFRFNTSFLLLTIFSLPCFFIILIKRKNNILIVLFSLFILFFMQTLFVNDYYYRKMIFIFPILLMIISIVYLEKDLIKDLIKSNSKFKIISIIYLIISLIISYILIDNSLGVMSIVNKLVLGVVFITLLLCLLDYRIKVNYLLFIFLIFSFSNLYLNSKYIYFNPTFKYRDTMISLQHELDNKYVIGWSHAFRLYNKSNPLMNRYIYHHLDKQIEVNHKKKLIDEYNIKYEIVLFNKNNRELDGFDLIKVLDINEALDRKLGLFRIKDDK